eukprot:CAMPEP_0174949254 /NCGR_PEP_ID=MMETSP1355-20121228/91068_1 /TAXON_ID=464990 /ORGANISM="Hemiselmis tepida, Strain CCMP443" /LENGTH=108 /DNA_ID=CAMNT_0016196801 /DNA_START=30 /DNA_END=353 /DNA_ORIENTATION=+
MSKKPGKETNTLLDRPGDPRTRSVEEVVLVRRALGSVGAPGGDRRGGGGGKSRPSTVGEQRRVHAAPIETKARSSVHPQQGSVMSRSNSEMYRSAAQTPLAPPRGGGG